MPVWVKIWFADARKQRNIRLRKPDCFAESWCFFLLWSNKKSSTYKSPTGLKPPQKHR